MPMRCTTPPYTPCARVVLSRVHAVVGLRRAILPATDGPEVRRDRHDPYAVIDGRRSDGPHDPDGARAATEPGAGGRRRVFRVDARTARRELDARRSHAVQPGRPRGDAPCDRA